VSPPRGRIARRGRAIGERLADQRSRPGQRQGGGRGRAKPEFDE